jgi:hypothetical protein
LADNTALRGAATVGAPPTYSNGATGTVGRIADARYVTDALSYATTGGVTLSGDVTGATNANSIGTGAVTYPKLNTNAKTYAITAFTASDDFTSDSLSSNLDQNPFIRAEHASTPIVLSLPTGIGTTGATITVCQTGAASVTIRPKSGAAATINGSTSNTYILGGQYSVVTLVCISGFSSTWVIAGDYI